MPAPHTTFEVFTLFPEAVEGFVRAGLLGKAIERGLVEVRSTNYRDFAHDKHRTVDDTPFGGGAGMVIKPEPVVEALEAVEARRGPMHRILLTPSAPRFDQRVAERLARLPRIALVCGRYEGIDDRVREHFVDECLSLGDFVLGGGEVAALAIIEAVARLHEGVLGNPESALTESFAVDDGGRLLEHPQYTRPAEFRGHRVPEVLLSGNHAAIARWRADAARRRTWSLRPDLRQVTPLRPEAPVHLAWSGMADPPERLAELCTGHRLAGVVVLGDDAERPVDVVAWVRASGGKVPVTAFRNLQALRKRLRQRSGHTPFVVAVVDHGDAPTAQRDPGAVLDARAASVGDPLAPLVVWVPAEDPSPVDLADAVFAPVLAPAGDEPLAKAPSIADASRPRTRRVTLAARALDLLYEPGDASAEPSDVAESAAPER